MKEKSLLLNLTGDMLLFKIIDFVLENKGMNFSKTDIAKAAEMSRASLSDHWAELEKQGVIKTTRSFGKMKLYTLNSKSPITQKIIELERTLISEAILKEYKTKVITLAN